MKKILRFTVLVLAGLFIIAFATTANADRLLWDDPGANWDVITGYTIYYSDGGQNYNKSVLKAVLERAGGNVIYDDMEGNLNLHYDTEYSVHITAYNNSGESGPSNIITFTREGYSPPLDQLPSEVVSSPQLPSGLETE